MSEQDLAQQTLATILRAGFDKAACHVSRDELHELQAENGEINLLRTNFETDIQLVGIAEERRASLSINKTDEASIGQAVHDLKGLAAGANPDPAHAIAEKQPAESFAGGAQKPDYDAMYDRLREVIDYCAATYPNLILGPSSVVFVKRRSCFVNSNGVQFESERGTYNAGVEFSSKAGKDTSSMMYTGYSRISLDKPIHEETNVDQLLRESTEQVRTQNIPVKFVGDLVIAPSALRGFIGFLTMRIGDAAMIAGTSVYKDKLGDKVASDMLTVHSRPVGEELVRGYWVTSDGYKAENSTIVDNGVLRTYLLSLYGANKTGLARAVNSGGCYVVEPGLESYEKLIAGVEQGILLTRFSGGRPNDRGDFSGVAKNSYYIRDGEVQFPIRETTVSGNMVDLLQSVQAISRDRLDYGDSVLPWVRVSGITAS